MTKDRVALLLKLLVLAAIVYGMIETSDRVSSLRSRLKYLESRISDVEKQLPPRAETLDCKSGSWRSVAVPESFRALAVRCIELDTTRRPFLVRLQIVNPYLLTLPALSGLLHFGFEPDAKDARSRTHFTVPPLEAGQSLVTEVPVQVESLSEIREFILLLNESRENPERADT